MTGLVDTHAHLMDPAFEGDRGAVLERAAQAGVEALVLVGYDVSSSRAAVELARAIPGAGAAVGIHPNFAAAASEADFAEIAELAHAAEVVAIGETGLDNYRQNTPRERQREAFAWHLRLAEECNLPPIVHNREADADVLAVVAEGGPRGVLHCFSSTDPGYLERLLESGFYVSFAGPLTFKNGEAVRDMAARVPRDRLLVETDCPYLAPEPHRGRRNEPAYVRDTAARLANVLELSLEDLTHTLWTNSHQAFVGLRREVAA